MATLLEHKAQLPMILAEKYRPTQLVGFANTILEILSSERLLKDSRFVRGVIVKHRKWITPPSNFRHAISLEDPTDPNSVFRYAEEGGKLRLIDRVIEEESSPDSVDAFTNSGTGSITVNISGVEKGDYEDYLLVVTAGDKLDRTYRIASNDASDNAAGTTKLYFSETLSFALAVSGTTVDITAANLISPDHYLLLAYRGTYEELESVNDEVPIHNGYERRIMKIGLIWQMYERTPGAEEEAGLWEGKWERLLRKIRDEIYQASTNQRVIPARWTGLIHDSTIDNKDEDDEDQD